MILISFLGTTAYGETIYRWQDQEIQTAYSAAACSHFLNPDEILILGTEEALAKNRENLCSALHTIQAVEPQFRLIPLGKNESELWQIFSDFTEAIPANSDIAIDLTNGQRSLPAVVILASIFMKTGLNVNVRHLFYGAYKVDPDMPNRSPMFDLSSMLNLVDWGIAADRFNRDGDARDLTKEFTDFGKQYAKNHEGNERKAGHTLRKLGENLDEISRCYLLLRPKYIHDAEVWLQQNLEQARASLEYIPEQRPLQLLLDRMEATYLPKKQESANEATEMLIRERDMIKWYRDHGHFMQATALSREWLLSWYMVSNGMTSVKELDNRELRDNFNVMLNAPERKAVLPEIVDENRFLFMYDTLGSLRNDLMHAGKRENPTKPKELYKTVYEQIDKLMQIPLPVEGK